MIIFRSNLRQHGGQHLQPKIFLVPQPIGATHGTTHIVLEPLDLMARLAALVPKPRMHLTRYHGVFAPHSQHRTAVTPAHRGPGEADRTKVTTPRHVAMSDER